MVNEEVVRLMKWTDGAVGKWLNDFDKAGTIVGVFRMCAIRLFFISSFPRLWFIVIIPVTLLMYV